MIIKQSLKFLDTFCFGREKQEVAFTRQANKIYGSVIIRDAIEVVDMPVLGERFPIYSLPSQDMLTDIVSFISSGVVGFVNQNITLSVLNSSPLPITSLIPTGHSAMFTAMGISIINKTTANWTWVFMFQSPLLAGFSSLFRVGFTPSLACSSARFSTPIYIFVWHTLIITHRYKLINIDRKFLAEKLPDVYGKEQ